jgi:hypothetical protein
LVPSPDGCDDLVRIGGPREGARLSGMLMDEAVDGGLSSARMDSHGPCKSVAIVRVNTSQGRKDRLVRCQTPRVRYAPLMTVIRSE